MSATPTPPFFALGVTRVEGLAIHCCPQVAVNIPLQAEDLVDFDGFESFDGRDVLFIDVGGYAADKVGGSRAGHWMMLEGIMADLKRRGAERGT